MASKEQSCWKTLKHPHSDNNILFQTSIRGYTYVVPHIFLFQRFTSFRKFWKIVVERRKNHFLDLYTKKLHSSSWDNFILMILKIFNSFLMERACCTVCQSGHLKWIIEHYLLVSFIYFTMLLLYVHKLIFLDIWKEEKFFEVFSLNL